MLRQRLQNYSEWSASKVMDSRFRRKLVRNHDVVTGAFEAAGWRLHDQLIYIRTVTGSFTNPVTAQCGHGYFLVFRKDLT